VQRIFYSANPDPESFWTSTFDEVLLVIQGQVDKWRVERRNAHRIHETFVGSDKALSILDFNPLPYDDELLTVESGLTDKEIYDLVKASGQLDKPL
jgi:hypothetical protein